MRFSFFSFFFLNNRPSESNEPESIAVSGNQITIGGKSSQFDGVFSGTSKQSEVYDDVVKPHIDDVLAGFQCTVFGFGRTGTGKTHTMIGGKNVSNNFLLYQFTP